jgi:phosphoribosyl 1,2-cyclic phosphodiesterase
MLFSAESNTKKNNASIPWTKEQQALRQQMESHCQVSRLAIRPQGGPSDDDDGTSNPKGNKNYRNNPSLLIHHYPSSSLCSTTIINNNNTNTNEKTGETATTTSATPKNVIIDVGKTFRETSLRWFPEFGITSLDAIVLTHQHMDAAAGLDDVRGFQTMSGGRYDAPKPTTTTTTTNNRCSSSDDPQKQKLKPTPPPPPPTLPRLVPMPLYLSQPCHDILSVQFPWLLPPPPLSQEIAVPKDTGSDGNTVEVKRLVASFDVHIVENLTPFSIDSAGLTMIPLPVWHGEDLISLGFAFSVQSRRGRNGGSSSSSSDESVSSSSITNPSPTQTTTSTTTTTNVVYLSDISRMVPETLEYILTRLQPTDILIVDSLLWHDAHSVHYSLEQAVALRNQLQPRQATYLIGMNCDDFLPHDEMNEYLAQHYGKNVIVMAHDGLAIEL